MKADVDKITALMKDDRLARLARNSDQAAELAAVQLQLAEVQRAIVAIVSR